MSDYYFNCLSDEHKFIYNLIFDGINALNTKIILPPIAQRNLFAIYNSVLLDNPIIFYTRSYQYRSGGNNLALMPMYNYTEDFINQSVDLLNDFLQSFDIVRNVTDIEKELFVHDYCLNNFLYDYEFNNHSFSILGLIIYGRGVCEGISKFVKIVLNYLNVSCIVVSGEAFNYANDSTEPHMWNIVSLDDEPYHLDVTFDMSQKSEINRYDYFNLPDTEIKRDHFFTEDLPLCRITGNDYYSLCSQVALDFTELENYIKSELTYGRNHIVIKLKLKQNEPNIFDYVTSIALRQYQTIYINKSSLVDVRYNPKQYVFEIHFF